MPASLGSPTRREIVQPALFALTAIAIGGLIGIVSDLRWPLAAIGAAAICAAVPLLLRPDWICALLVTALVSIDEFPNALGEVAERSLRTPFYSQSLGVPGLYAPDLLLIAGIALFVLRRMLRQRPLLPAMDRIGWVVAAVALAALVAIAASLAGGNPLREVTIELTTGMEYDINQRGLRLIAVFQFKTLLLLTLAWLLGRLWFAEPGSRRSFAICLAIGIGVDLVAGSVRLALHPSLPRSGDPLFYDSPATWFFSLFAMYTVAAWAFDLHRRGVIFAASLVSLVLLLFVAVSYRRTMWGAGIASAALLFALLPGRRQRRLLLIGFSAGAVLIAVALATPLGETVIESVLRRIGQTSSSDLSTVYRVAIALYMSEHWQQVPFFGYGLKPLWNEIVSLELFRTNIENVHSLYYWWFLRTGWFGGLVAIGGSATVFWECLRTHRRATDPVDRVSSLMLLLAFSMFAFSGLFNPVYGEARYIVSVGLGLGLLSRIREDVAGENRPQREGT